MTRQEWKLVLLLFRGLRDEAIAKRMHIKLRTVRFHLQNLFRKFGVHNRVALLIKLAR